MYNLDICLTVTDGLVTFRDRDVSCSDIRATVLTLLSVSFGVKVYYVILLFYLISSYYSVVYFLHSLKFNLVYSIRNL